jgi:hypothetical protein
MPDFWLTSGFHLLERNANGWLVLTDDFLRAYFQRPEIRPIADSCAAEIALHEELLDNPRVAVPESFLAEVADPDARENYQVVLKFRDHLLAHESIEAAYLALFEQNLAAVPALFIDQLAHIILRNILDRCEDPMRVRAAELFFRAQRLSLRDGAIMLADEDTVEMHAETGGFGSLGQLLQQNNTPTRTIELDVLTPDNAAIYWDRADRFDTVLDFSFARPGLDAFCRVLEEWTRHLLGIRVRIQPVERISDEHWVWHVGLDVEANAILNDLYNGTEVDEPRLARLVSLFRLEFTEAGVTQPAVQGRPVYLGMAITQDNTLRIKPQNILFNLPLAEQS